MVSVVDAQRAILVDPIGTNVWSGQVPQSLNSGGSHMVPCQRVVRVQRSVLDNPHGSDLWHGPDDNPMAHQQGEFAPYGVVYPHTAQN